VQDSIPDPFQVRNRNNIGSRVTGLICPQVPPTDDVRNLVSNLKVAQKDVSQMKNMPGSMNKVSNGMNTYQSVVDQFDNMNSCLQPIKIFGSVVQTISNVHPLSFGAHITKLRLDPPICKTSSMCTIMGCSGTSKSYMRLHYM